MLTNWDAKVGVGPVDRKGDREKQFHTELWS